MIAYRYYATFGASASTGAGISVLDSTISIDSAIGIM